MSEEGKKKRPAFPRAALVKSRGVTRKRRGRPPMHEVAMQDITIRVSKQTLRDAVRLIEKAGAWPEFAEAPPTRSGVLRLAMIIGLKTLEKR